jgi:cytochrome b subunit of formate dehydrogenase
MADRMREYKFKVRDCHLTFALQFLLTFLFPIGFAISHLCLVFRVATLIVRVTAVVRMPSSFDETRRLNK